MCRWCHEPCRGEFCDETCYEAFLEANEELVAMEANSLDNEILPLILENGK